MKNIYLLLLLLLPCALKAQDGVFVENKGQWDARAKFRMSLPSGYAFLESSAITYKIIHPDVLPEHPHPGDEAIASRTSNEPSEVIGHVLRANFLNSQNPTPKGEGEVKTKYNFFIGDSQSNWAAGASAYNKVHYASLYPNIDLELYLNYGNLKYDLIVQPNGKPEDISFVYEGNEGIEIQNGRLRVYTNFNVLEEQVPIAYQYINGEKVEVVAKFVLEEEIVSFAFPEGYNRDFPLIIDPELVFSTYSGSAQDNWGFTATYDEEGNAYTAGLTRGFGDFPATVGVIISNPTSNQSDPVSSDIGILKFSPEGDELLYATYLGGNDTDLPHSLLVNHQNQLVILGSTGSSDFPTTTGAFDRTFNGGTYLESSISMAYNRGSDIFVAVLNENATSLIGSTYLGGSGNDGLDLTGFSFLTKNYGDEFRGDIQVDESDNIYLVSTTLSSNFPTRNAFQPTYRGGQDGVICSFNSNLSTLRWSSFMGGSRQDGVFSIRLTNQGDLAVCGGTNSTDFPIAGSPLNSSLAGDIDGFVALLPTTGERLTASTYLGTNNYDQAYLLDTDEEDNIVVFGQTLGSYPISNGVYSNPNSGQFLHKLTPDLSATVFSTVFGSGNSSINIRPTAFVVSNCDNMLISGWGGALAPEHLAASTAGMPTTPDNIPATRETSSGDDFYLMIMSSDATEMVYGAFIGGTNSGDMDHVDGGTSRFDKNGIMYQAVCVCRENNFPATANAYQVDNASSNGCNNVVFKFDLKTIQAQVNPNVMDELTGVFVPGNEGCAPLDVLFTPEGIVGTDLRWNFGDGSTAGQSSPGNISHTYTEPGTYTVTLQSVNPTTCEQVVEAIGTVEVYGTDFSISPSVEICSGESVTITASGAVIYEWETNETLSSTNTAATIATPTETTTYQVFLEDERGCEGTLSTTVSITEADFELESESLGACDQLPGVRVFTQVDPQTTINWQLDGMPIEVGTNHSYDFLPTSIGQYVFIAEMVYKGCSFYDTLVLDVEVHETNFSISPPVEVCPGESVTLTASGAVAYQWVADETLSSTNTATTVATPTETTTYQVILKDEQGCEDTLSTTVSVTEAEFVLESELLANCDELPDFRIFTEVDPQTPINWQLDGASIEVGTNHSYDFSPTSIGQYVFVAEMEYGGCSFYDTLVLDVKVNETGFSISSSVEICPGESATLTAFGAVDYQWVADETLSSTNTAITIASPTETTTYQVILKSELGCVDTLSTTVSIIEAEFELESELLETCEQLPTFRVFTDVDPQTTINWELDGAPIEVGTAHSYDFSPTDIGQYVFIAEMLYKGCSFYDTLVLDVVYNNIDLGFQDAIVIGGGTICGGDTLRLSATEGFVYEWTPADNLSSTNTASVLAYPTQTTEYVVKISNGMEICFIEKKVLVEVAPEVTFDIQYDFQYECAAYPQVVFTNNSVGVDEYQWYWEGDLFNSTEAPSAYQPSQSGVQTLKVEGSNSECYKEFSLDIEIPEMVLPPNVITPNGDGKNDTFVIYGIQGWTVQIYNRWGRLVYETKEYQNDWAGRGETGETFYYLLTAPDGTVCKGWLQVVGN